LTDDTKKNRGLTTRTPLSNAVDSTLYKNLDELHSQTKIPKSKLLDEALADLVVKYKKSGKVKL